MSPPPWTLFWPRSGLSPGAVAADVAAEQAEVDEREDVVDRVVVLGDPERPADHRPVGARVGVRRLADHLGRHARQPLALLERERLDRGRVLLEPLGRPLDEGRVVEPRVDDLAGHRVRERDVGADVEPEPAVGPLRRRRAARVDDEEARAVPHPFEEVVEEDRMRLPGVRAPEEDHVRLLDLAVRRRPAARSEHRRQTDDARCVSGAVTRVDVVRAHHLARELLRQEVHLVRRLRAREDPERRRRVRLAGPREPAATVSSASSQEAGRSASPSRTSGVVRRPFMHELLSSLVPSIYPGIRRSRSCGSIPLAGHPPPPALRQRVRTARRRRRAAGRHRRVEHAGGDLLVRQPAPVRPSRAAPAGTRRGAGRPRAARHACRRPGRAALRARARPRRSRRVGRVGVDPADRELDRPAPPRPRGPAPRGQAIVSR